MRRAVCCRNRCFERPTASGLSPGMNSDHSNPEVTRGPWFARQTELAVCGPSWPRRSRGGLLMFAKLWRDEAGFIVSMELLFVATILILGMIVGWTLL